MLGEGWSPKLKEPGQDIEGRTRTEYPRKGDSFGWLQHCYVGYALFRRGHLIQTRPKMRKEKGRIIALGGEISGWSRAGKRPKTLQWTASHQSQEMILPRRTSDKLAGSSARNWRGYSDARERQEQRWCFPDGLRSHALEQKDSARTGGRQTRRGSRQCWWNRLMRLALSSSRNERGTGFLQVR